MSKILVTGGAGFIGSHLVDALIALGYDVFVIDNLSTGKKEYINPDAKFFEIDVRQREELENVISREKFDSVFHLAAQIHVRKSIDDPVFDNEVNVVGSINLFEAAGKNGVKKIIFMSSGGALYDSVTSQADENFPIKPSNPYGIHKFAAEGHLRSASEKYGCKYGILRPSNAYGPRQFKGGEGGVISIFTNNHSNGEISALFGDGSKTRDYIYVHDLVSACLKAMDKGEGIYNISSGIEISMLEMIKIIEKASGRPFDYEQFPDRLGEAWRSVLSPEKAKNELGWTPSVDIKTGIKKVLEWLEENKTT